MATALTETAAIPAINPAQRLGQLTTGYQMSACLYAAASLSIADLLASGPRGIDELASETKTDANRLYRRLRALVSVGGRAGEGQVEISVLSRLIDEVVNLSNLRICVIRSFGLR